jgi:hypothetical protein
MGTGPTLLKDVIKEGEQKNRSVYLESSALRNIPWYDKFGFNEYANMLRSGM